ncbi:hypothetical protein LX32DRAFT_181650 [Colletotrichum zoysiae]|uniref:Uncharacterized protein n=1 Tax=Colletotrichum zoysiae TaxID=1216348 RepID=A0AAD9HRI8_9PEZI|nr:hypothetical protein LX32DRAFT_181650 [Colletotrichum zoysiae]
MHSFIYSGALNRWLCVYLPTQQLLSLSLSLYVCVCVREMSLSASNSNGVMIRSSNKHRLSLEKKAWTVLCIRIHVYLHYLVFPFAPWQKQAGRRPQGSTRRQPFNQAEAKARHRLTRGLSLSLSLPLSLCLFSPPVFLPLLRLLLLLPSRPNIRTRTTNH